MNENEVQSTFQRYQSRLHEIIFEADTPAGRYFDMSLITAIVTLTTVGYGDISPVTPLGQLIATCIMLMGYGIIAVPTGIMSVEIARATERREIVVQACRSCGGHCYHRDAKFCMHCGVPLEF